MVIIVTIAASQGNEMSFLSDAQFIAASDPYRRCLNEIFSRRARKWSQEGADVLILRAADGINEYLKTHDADRLAAALLDALTGMSKALRAARGAASEH